MSLSPSPDYVDGEWSRVRRQADDTTTTSATIEDEKPARALLKYALYNATGNVTIVTTWRLRLGWLQPEYGTLPLLYGTHDEKRLPWPGNYH